MSTLDKFWGLVDACKATLEGYDEGKRLVGAVVTVHSAGKRCVEIGRLLKELHKEAKQRNRNEDG
jgi:hypothetical protein